MFTWLLPRRQHLHALRTANPWRADRRAGERGRDTEGERESKKEGGKGNLSQGRIPI